MHVLTVELTIKPECLADFLQELQQFSRFILQQEADCLRFEIFQDDNDPGRILLLEGWSSRRHLEEVQLQRAYYQPYFARVHTMFAAERQLRHWRALPL
ncbi:putative quinol monooxygenase [Aquitalea aquatica]|uniref:Antibiotic biosynthesis monooxygenase n=1 Tax=Aquitalea aquatica TaxID=3044273 RepID=A0A838Y202_9NEIS|nr:antibiotic biosynthesis monooxygenase [Aquitalea magnusonii]MBA4707302.1 antibiotic biosynthesis monooxygenase [Aquitalea magnusonii]